MLKVEIDNDVVTGITFPVPLADDYTTHGAIDHVMLAEVLKDKPLATVLIETDWLDRELYEDPLYMTVRRNLYVSKIEEEAMRRFGQKYMSMEGADGFLKDLGPLEVSNAVGEKESLRSKLLDGVFAGQYKSLFSEIIEWFREGFATVYDDETEITTPRENWEQEWPAELIRLWMPRVNTTYERVYSVPEPFTHWDSRNKYQQWYFIQGEDSITRRQGGTGSSGARFEQGIMAHTFALLSSQGKVIPTWYLRYDNKNVLRLVEKWDDFHVIDLDLSGNYHVDMRETRHLFEGRLIQDNDGQ